MATGLLDNWVASIEQENSLFEGISLSLANPDSLERVARAEQKLFHFLVQRMPSTVETLAELWQGILEDLATSAKHKDQFSEMVTSISRAARAIIRIVGVAESLWEKYPVLQVLDDDLLTTLAAVRNKLTDLESQTARLMTRLSKPGRPIDEERLAAGIQEAKEGRTVKARDFISHLRIKHGLDGRPDRV